MDNVPVLDGMRPELESRRQRVAGLLSERGLRGLIVFSDAAQPGNTRYLTNYSAFVGPAVLVVRDDGEMALVETFNWDMPRAHEASGLDRIYTGFDTPGLVRQALNDLSIPSAAPLGLVGTDVIPHVLYEAVVRESGRPELLDLQGPFTELRLIKSPLEQELLRQAAAATDAAIAAVLESVTPGMTELDVAALAEFHMKKAGADGLSFPASVAAGPHTEKPVSLPSSRPIERGDLVMLDVGAMWNGYCADVTRTFVVGPPGDRQLEVHRAVAEALGAATAAVLPGVPANELHRVAVRVLAEYELDQYFTHRVGHGIGLEHSLERPDLQRNEIALQPGMTFCIEPGVYVPGFGGVKIEDDIIVGAGGAEVISNVTRALVSV